jgi:hypothetical protein
VAGVFLSGEERRKTRGLGESFSRAIPSPLVSHASPRTAPANLTCGRCDRVSWPAETLFAACTVPASYPIDGLSWPTRCPFLRTAILFS